MTDQKLISPLKLSIGAAVAVVAFNIVARVLIEFEGTTVTTAIAGVVPALVFLWLVKVIRQKPTKAEVSRFVVLYSAILAGLAVIAVLLAYANNSLDVGGAVLLFVNYLAYPLFARIILSAKQLDHAFKS